MKLKSCFILLMAVLLLCLSGCGKDAETILDGFIESKVILTPPTEPITTETEYATFSLENQSFRKIGFVPNNTIQKKNGDSWDTIQSNASNEGPVVALKARSTLPYSIKITSSTTAGDYRLIIRFEAIHDGKPTYAVCYFTIIEE